MSLMEMTAELRTLQAEEPAYFSEVFPPDIALRVDQPGLAKDHFDQVVKQSKLQTQRKERADTLQSTKWVIEQMAGRGAAKLGRASGGAPGSPARSGGDDDAP